jgi:hypothetical protein
VKEEPFERRGLGVPKHTWMMQPEVGDHLCDLEIADAVTLSNLVAAVFAFEPAGHSAVVAATTTDYHRGQARELLSPPNHS